MKLTCIHGPSSTTRAFQNETVFATSITCQKYIAVPDTETSVYPYTGTRLGGIAVEMATLVRCTYPWGRVHFAFWKQTNPRNHITFFCN